MTTTDGPCPTCGAPPAGRCRTPTGRTTRTHSRRHHAPQPRTLDEWDAAWLAAGRAIVPDLAQANADTLDKLALPTTDTDEDPAR